MRRVGREEQLQLEPCHMLHMRVRQMWKKAKKTPEASLVILGVNIHI